MILLGYPLSLVCVEKRIEDLPLLTDGKIPLRRIDVLCFAKGNLRPLLIVECKATSFTRQAVDQVIGYNYFIRSSFIALADDKKIITGWYSVDHREYQFVDRLLSYEEMQASLR